MTFVHINSHFAFGVIIASFFHHYITLNVFEFSAIVITSFIMDFDVFFSRFAKNRNHRMLITHSIIPGLFILIVGLIFMYSVIIICAFTYIIHIVVDNLDWGTNLFGFHKKPFGFKFLIKEEELKNLDEILANYKINKSFFDFRYYSNKIVLGCEVVLFILMVLFLGLFAIEYILSIIGYVVFLLFHLQVYFKLRKIEQI